MYVCMIYHFEMGIAVVSQDGRIRNVSRFEFLFCDVVYKLLTIRFQSFIPCPSELSVSSYIHLKLKIDIF